MDRKKLSNKHEKDIANALKGRVQIASGAIPLVGMKGDIISASYCVECKATLKNYYILKRKIVEKIEKEALKCFRVPLLAIRTSLGDYILFRVFDFFTDTPDKYGIICKDSLKINSDMFKSVGDDGLLFLVGDTYWSLVTLDNFKDNIDWR